MSRSYHVSITGLSNSNVAKKSSPSSSTTIKSKTKHTSSSGPGSKSAETNVVYVSPQNAKPLKNQLSELKCLDKGFRMTKMDDGRIAVPIVENVFQTQNLETSTALSSLILGSGRETMPFSTAHFASKK